MKRPSHESILEAMRDYLEQFEKLALESPEEARQVAHQSLIDTGVLNEDGSPKENIVTDPHIGPAIPSMSSKKEGLVRKRRKLK